jgi:hypothetical protein
MADITELIREDHDWFREQFAKLDGLRARTPVDPRALQQVWRPLAQYRDFMAAHPTARGLLIVDRDPKAYVAEHEKPARQIRTDFSLRIGSLKGQ